MRAFMVDEIALEARGVSKRYGEHDALHNVDLIVRPGRLHGLLGPNGAGKTTLMRVVLGLARRNSGSLRLLGHSCDSTDGPLPSGVGGLVEAPSFYPYLSARRNLALLARLDDHRRSDRNRIVVRALEQVGLDAQAHVAVSGYSAGMRQRLGLAAALLRSPRLLVLDEPTNSLDPAAARDVRALAQRLADEGAAVVLSSHDLAEVEELCAEVTIINRGRVAFSGAVDELRARAPADVHSLHTSDDPAALAVASERQGVAVAPGDDGGLDVAGQTDALDAYVIALGCAGIAVRSLERRVRSVESLFFELTRQGGPHPSPEPASLGVASERRPSPAVV
jgi:ABC-2 type transport system ATP-binding protein